MNQKVDQTCNYASCLLTSAASAAQYYHLPMYLPGVGHRVDMRLKWVSGHLLGIGVRRRILYPSKTCNKGRPLKSPNFPALGCAAVR